MIDKNFQTGCVLIVGGSGGIGSLCAKEFAKAGAKVAITYYKNEQAALDIANEIKKNNGNLLKPIRLIQDETSNKFFCVDGRLKYWAWVYLYGYDSKIESVVY